MSLKLQGFLNQNNILGSVLESNGVKFKNITKKQNGFFDIYDIEVSLGFRISKIEAILDEIGMFLKSKEKPVGYPISDKGIYRIEAQRDSIKPKRLSRLLSVDTSNMLIPTCIGTMYNGQDLIVDLSTVPNLLIGGTTGSGKSVLLHNIIISNLKNKSSVYLVDPKQVEFSMYEYASSVSEICTTISEFKLLLSKIFKKMNNIYTLLKANKCRSLKEYNFKTPPYKRVRPIVVVIDEWADIYLQDKNIQEDLCLIAQKGRAAGISIVLATQRPSSDIISGLIKANFPGRICLRVASSIDSKVVLDRKGGESISDIGCGLYLDGSFREPVKFKTPYVKDIDRYIRRANGII